jgi:hypothetical protein
MKEGRKEEKNEGTKEEKTEVVNSNTNCWMK